MDIHRDLKIELSKLLNVAEEEIESIHYGEKTWDSLAHMNVISMVEEVYDLELEEDEMLEIISLNALTELVTRKINR